MLPKAAAKHFIPPFIEEASALGESGVLHGRQVEQGPNNEQWHDIAKVADILNRSFPIEAQHTSSHQLLDYT